MHWLTFAHVSTTNEEISRRNNETTTDREIQKACIALPWSKTPRFWHLVEVPMAVVYGQAGSASLRPPSLLVRLLSSYNAAHQHLPPAHVCLVLCARCLMNCGSAALFFRLVASLGVH